MALRKLVVGNWKMNGLTADGRDRTAQVAARLAGEPSAATVVLCPPFTLLHGTGAAIKGTSLHLGGQDCHAQPSGAFTGSISAPMLKDAGCSYVILGHSERRQLLGETSDSVRAKAKAAHEAGLIAIICVGETDAERTAGQAMEIVRRQIQESLPETATAQNTAIAYEPVWAIGTGKTAQTSDILVMHKTIRAGLGKIMQDAAVTHILYGGSVKADNAGEILHTQEVDGVLVGGASLKADEFLSIIAAA
jgi:triosephosphate isomerase